MKKRNQVFMLAIILFLFTGSSLFPNDETENIKKCNEYIKQNKKDLNAVMQCALMEYQAYSKIANIYSMSGKDELHKKDKRGAIHDKMDMILAHSPAFPLALYIKADLFGSPVTSFTPASGIQVESPDLAKGIEYAAQAYKADPKNTDILTLYSSLLMYADKRDEALPVAAGLGKKSELYRVISDFSATDIPDKAVFDFQSSARYVGMKYGSIPFLNSHPFQKIRYYYYPGSFEDFKSALKTPNASFQKLSEKRNMSEPVMYLHYLIRDGEKLEFANDKQLDKIKSSKNIYNEFNGISYYIYEFDNPKQQDADYKDKLKRFPVLKKSKKYCWIILKDFYH